MTYAIFNIVYGIDLTELGERNGVVDKAADEGLVETSYSGSGPTPYWVGADLGGGDECSSDTSGMRLVSTPEDVAEYAAKRESLLAYLDASEDDGAKSLADTVRSTEPVVFLAWGTS